MAIDLPPAKSVAGESAPVPRARPADSPPFRRFPRLARVGRRRVAATLRLFDEAAADRTRERSGTTEMRCNGQTG